MHPPLVSGVIAGSCHWEVCGPSLSWGRPPVPRFRGRAARGAGWGRTNAPKTAEAGTPIVSALTPKLVPRGPRRGGAAPVSLVVV